MPVNYRLRTRVVPILAGLAGLGLLASLPVIAQVNTPTPSPSTPGQPSPSPTPSPGSPPPTPTPSTPGQPSLSPSTPAPGNTSDRSLSELLQQASSAGSFRTLAQAVEAAGLTTVLQDRGGEYTIFAPTDEAFAALPSGTLQLLLRPENRDLLRRILAYHVVPREVTSNQLRTGGLSTLGGGLAIRVTPERVIVNNGSVVQADIQASDGVIHAVNRVMIPTSVRQQLAGLR